MRRSFAHGSVKVVFRRLCTAFCLLLPLGVAAANEVTDWNVILEQTAKDSSIKGGTVFFGRNAALMHIAMHDALNAITHRYEPYGVRRAFPDANVRAAVIAAGHGVAVRLYPDRTDALAAVYDKMLAAIPDEPSKKQGIMLGGDTAAQIVALRADDHFDYVQGAGEDFVSGKGPFGTGHSAWYPAPDSPHQNAVFSRVAQIAPLVLKNPSQFRNLLPGPLKMGTVDYARDLEEVKMLGSKTSTVRTPEQTQIGMLWAEPSLFRLFNEVARNLISARNDDLWASTRTLALLNVAIADSYLAVFDAKYHYQFWRPTMAVRWADKDGNQKTTSDPNWVPLMPTPPFPEYPSGHAGACGGAQVVLENAFGRNTPFTATSTLMSGYRREFKSFDEAARECVDGRVLSGAHFRFSNEDAMYLDQHIGRYVLRTVLAASGQ